MKIDYDKKADAKYVRIKKGKISYTKEENDWLLFDCAKNGEVLGVEILNASTNLISIHTMKGRFLGISTMRSKLLSKDKESLGLTVDSPKYEKEDQFVFA